MHLRNGYLRGNKTEAAEAAEPLSAHNISSEGAPATTFFEGAEAAKVVHVFTASRRDGHSVSDNQGRVYSCSLQEHSKAGTAPSALAQAPTVASSNFPSDDPSAPVPMDFCVPSPSRFQAVAHTGCSNSITQDGNLQLGTKGIFPLGTSDGGNFHRSGFIAGDKTTTSPAFGDAGVICDGETYVDVSINLLSDEASLDIGGKSAAVPTSCFSGPGHNYTLDSVHAYHQSYKSNSSGSSMGCVTSDPAAAQEGAETETGSSLFALSRSRGSSSTSLSATRTPSFFCEGRSASKRLRDPSPSPTKVWTGASATAVAVAVDFEAEYGHTTSTPNSGGCDEKSCPRDSATAFTLKTLRLALIWQKIKGILLGRKSSKDRDPGSSRNSGKSMNWDSGGARKDFRSYPIKLDELHSDFAEQDELEVCDPSPSVHDSSTTTGYDGAVPSSGSGTCDGGLCSLDGFLRVKDGSCAPAAQNSRGAHPEVTHADVSSYSLDPFASTPAAASSLSQRDSDSTGAVEMVETLGRDEASESEPFGPSLPSKGASVLYTQPFAPYDAPAEHETYAEPPGTVMISASAAGAATAAPAPYVGSSALVVVSTGSGGARAYEEEGSTDVVGAAVVYSTKKRRVEISPHAGRVGLYNLGNTCFLNSSLQCLLHCAPLVKYFLGTAFKEDLNPVNPLGLKGELAEAFGEVVTAAWMGSKSVLTPRKFKETFERFNTAFKGYHQHDSQEFLASLLDGLHEDVNRVRLKPYLEAAEAGGRPDAALAREAWATHRCRNDSAIVDHFHGLYRSTLDCLNCGHQSRKFEPFMYLSVPIPERRRVILTVLVMDSPDQHLAKQPSVAAIDLANPAAAFLQDKEEGQEHAGSPPLPPPALHPHRYSVEVPAQGTVEELLTAVAAAAGLPVGANPLENHMLLATVSGPSGFSEPSVIFHSQLNDKISDVLPIKKRGYSYYYDRSSSESGEETPVVYFWHRVENGPRSAGLRLAPPSPPSLGQRHPMTRSQGPETKPGLAQDLVVVWVRAAKHGALHLPPHAAAEAFVPPLSRPLPHPQGLRSFFGHAWNAAGGIPQAVSDADGGNTAAYGTGGVAYRDRHDVVSPGSPDAERGGGRRKKQPGGAGARRSCGAGSKVFRGQERKSGGRKTHGLDQGASTKLNGSVEGSADSGSWLYGATRCTTTYEFMPYPLVLFPKASYSLFDSTPSGGDREASPGVGGVAVEDEVASCSPSPLLAADGATPFPDDDEDFSIRRNRLAGHGDGSEGEEEDLIADATEPSDSWMSTSIPNDLTSAPSVELFQSKTRAFISSKDLVLVSSPPPMHVSCPSPLASRRECRRRDHDQQQSSAAGAPETLIYLKTYTPCFAEVVRLLEPLACGRTSSMIKTSHLTSIDESRHVAGLREAFSSYALAAQKWEAWRVEEAKATRAAAAPTKLPDSCPDQGQVFPKGAEPASPGARSPLKHLSKKEWRAARKAEEKATKRRGKHQDCAEEVNSRDPWSPVKKQSGRNLKSSATRKEEKRRKAAEVEAAAKQGSPESIGDKREADRSASAAAGDVRPWAADDDDETLDPQDSYSCSFTAESKGATWDSRMDHDQVESAEVVAAADDDSVVSSRAKDADEGWVNSADETLKCCPMMMIGEGKRALEHVTTQEDDETAENDDDKEDDILFEERGVEGDGESCAELRLSGCATRGADDDAGAEVPSLMQGVVKDDTTKTTEDGAAAAPRPAYSPPPVGIPFLIQFKLHTTQSAASPDAVLRDIQSALGETGAEAGESGSEWGDGAAGATSSYLSGATIGSGSYGKRGSSFGSNPNSFEGLSFMNFGQKDSLSNYGSYGKTDDSKSRLQAKWALILDWDRSFASQASSEPSGFGARSGTRFGFDCGSIADGYMGLVDDTASAEAVGSEAHIYMGQLSVADAPVFELAPLTKAVDDDSVAKAAAAARSHADVSLYECVESYLKPEHLVGGDAWYCSQCKTHVSAEKKLALWSLPEILIIHLKRFSFHRYRREKLNTIVNYPLRGLDLSKYLLKQSPVAAVSGPAYSSSSVGLQGLAAERFSEGPMLRDAAAPPLLARAPESPADSASSQLDVSRLVLDRCGNGEEPKKTIDEDTACDAGASTDANPSCLAEGNDGDSSRAGQMEMECSLGAEVELSDCAHPYEGAAAAATPLPLYDLVAVSNHMGGVDGGHYTAFAKLMGPGGSWCSFNDSGVTPESEVDVEGQSAAYVLFYRRRAEAEADPEDALPRWLEERAARELKRKAQDEVAREAREEEARRRMEERRQRQKEREQREQREREQQELREQCEREAERHNMEADLASLDQDPDDGPFSELGKEDGIFRQGDDPEDQEGDVILGGSLVSSIEENSPRLLQPRSSLDSLEEWTHPNSEAAYASCRFAGFRHLAEPSAEWAVVPLHSDNSLLPYPASSYHCDGNHEAEGEGGERVGCSGDSADDASSFGSNAERSRRHSYDSQTSDGERD